MTCPSGLMTTVTVLLQLVDLPCIIESHKTTDRKTLYKTADISQVFIVVNVTTDFTNPSHECI